ncbi:major facilitator superfamily domain-containing protein [Circinella umbellata]|nr:major facilitator superfamily domain-containing protein [Circinella umbellata]
MRNRNYMSTTNKQTNSYYHDYLLPHDDDKEVQQSITTHDHTRNERSGSNIVVISHEDKSLLDIKGGKAKEQQPKINEDSPSTTISPLDGREAWIVLTGLFVASVFTGLHSTWGVIQNYYINDRIFKGSSANLIIRLTSVGSLYQAMNASCTFLGNILYQILGLKKALLLSVLFLTVGLLCSSFANSVWHLYVTFGIMCAVGSGCSYLIGYRAIPSWFTKYRNTAQGIFNSCHPVGGIILPLIVNQINTDLGHAWMYRVLALLIFMTGIAAYPVVKERSVEDSGATMGRSKTHLIRDTLDFNLLKNPNFVIWITIGPIYLFAMYITLTFIPAWATYINLSDMQGALCVTVLSATAIPGSIINGMIADKIGSLNAFIICMTLTALTVFLNWIFAHDLKSLMFFCILHGLVYQCYYSTITSIMIAIVGTENYASALSFRALICILSILGPFLATYLDSLNTNLEPYFYIKMVAGSGYMVCALLALIIKYRINFDTFAKV